MDDNYVIDVSDKSLDEFDEIFRFFNYYYNATSHYALDVEYYYKDMKSAQERHFEIDHGENGVITFYFVEANCVSLIFFNNLTVDEFTHCTQVKINDLSLSEDRKLWIQLGQSPFTIVEPV